MHYLKLVHSAPRQPPCGGGFTSHDRIALSEWIRRSDAHGYQRVVIETGSQEGGPEEGGYVLLYTQDKAWAHWGMARGSNGIIIWHCGTGIDLGRFDTMLEALESLPPVRKEQLRQQAKPSGVATRFSLVHSA